MHKIFLVLPDVGGGNESDILSREYAQWEV